MKVENKINGKYLKCTIWKVLTYVCIHETITIIKMMNISINPQSFLVPLCEGGAFLDAMSFKEDLSEKVMFELNGEKEPFRKENSKQAFSLLGTVYTQENRKHLPTQKCVLGEHIWGAENGCSNYVQCAVWGGEWHSLKYELGPCKPEWEFGFYYKHSRESLENTM